MKPHVIAILGGLALSAGGAGPVAGAPAPTSRPPNILLIVADDQGFHYALRDGHSKLIADRSFAKRRLYDLARDRFEVDDRADREPGVVETLLGRLRRVAADVAGDRLRPR
ncbi:MAG TPA: hypothetical protein VIK51_17755 [Vicinamibacteria bacterium]|jgi:hypothetical protein